MRSSDSCKVLQGPRGLHLVAMGGEYMEWKLGRWYEERGWSVRRLVRAFLLDSPVVRLEEIKAEDQNSGAVENLDYLQD